VCLVFFDFNEGAVLLRAFMFLGSLAFFSHRSVYVMLISFTFRLCCLQVDLRGTDNWLGVVDNKLVLVLVSFC